MSKNKEQHKVPQSYLNQWSDKGEIKVFDFKTGLFHEKGNAKTLCRSPYFYNLDSLGEYKEIFDNYLTSIEDIGLPVIQKIQKKGLKLKPLDLNIEDKQALAFFIAAQKSRTSASKEDLNKIIINFSRNSALKMLEEDDFFRKLPKNDKELFEKVGKDKLKKTILKSELAVTNLQEMFLKFMYDGMEHLYNIYIQSKWFILFAGKYSSFITNDNPVVTLSQLKDDTDNTISNVNLVEILFALSPKVAVLLKYIPGKIPNHISPISISEETETKDSVREINFRIFMNSERYIYSSSTALLQNLKRRFYDTYLEFNRIGDIGDHSDFKIPPGKIPNNFKLINRQFNSEV